MVPRFVKAYYDAVAVRRKAPRWLQGAARGVFAAVVLAEDFEEAKRRLLGLAPAAGALRAEDRGDEAVAVIPVNAFYAAEISVRRDGVRVRRVRWGPR